MSPGFRDHNPLKPFGGEELKRHPFWLVWNPSAGAPTTRHGSEADAQKEAKRLAARNPGADFFVLKSIDGYRMQPPPPPPVHQLDIDPEWIPF